MRIVAAILSLATAPAFAMDLPSGESAAPLEPIWEAQGGETVLVLRYLTPQIAGAGEKVTFDEAEPDMAYLCEMVGLRLGAEGGKEPAEIIVTFMDREIARGQTNPEITQYFSAYRIENQRCISEPW